MLFEPVLEIQNQTLGQALRLAGTPFRLQYRSDRVRGRRAAYSLKIPLSGKTLPASLKGIELEIIIGKRRFTEKFPAAPALTHAFTWDGKDDQGRLLPGKQLARIRLGYVYQASYPRPEHTRWQEKTSAVGTWDARGQGLGGWTLNVHHAFDPVGRVFYPGEGPSRSLPDSNGSGAAAAAEILVPSDEGDQVFVFDPAGRHLRSLDALTGALLYRFEYDAAGRLSALADSYGNTTRIERTPEGVPTALVGPYGQRTTLTLNADGYLSSLANPAGATTKFSYAQEGLLAALTDPKGNGYRFTYDEQGRLTRLEDPAGGYSKLVGSRRGNAVQIAALTAAGREFNYLVERLAAGGERRVKKCCGGGQVEALHNPDGSRKVVGLDGTVSTEAHQPDPRWGRQAARLASLSRTTPSGLVSTLSAKRTATLAEPGKPLSLAALTDTLTINGRKYVSTFEAAKKQIAKTTPAGRQLVSTLDAKGRVMKVEIPGLQPVTAAYDAQGRITTITQGSGAEARLSAIQYDTQGRATAVIDPLQRTVRFDYNPAGQVTKQVLADGREIHYAYDANGYLISITPPGRPAHAADYTPVNRVREYRPPAVGDAGQATTFAYNPDKQLTRVTRPDGATLDFLYDEAGYLVGMKFPGGEKRFAYEPKTRNLITSTAPDGGTLSYAYDGFLLTQTAWAGTIRGRVSNAYENNFRLASRRVNDGPLTDYKYDADGLLIQAGALSLTRDPRNGLVTGTQLAHLSTTRGFNGFGERSRFAAAFQDKEILAVQYERDTLGRIIKLTETIAGQSQTYAYDYDLAGRLIDVRQDGAPLAHYDYDANGNRSAYKGPRGAGTARYDAQDRLLQYGETTYIHTANGEWASKTANGKTSRYEYDIFGHLRTAHLPDGTRVEYLLDAVNRRIGKKVNGTLVQGFLYQDELKPIAELDGQNQVVSRFFYATGANVPDYMEKGGKPYRILTDHLGSPRLVIDVITGALAQRMDYDEFGNVLQDTNPGFQPFGFAGGLYDRDTGFIRFGARAYDPDTGRWTSKDPLNFTSGDTNLYAYVRNDPVNFTDPLGLWEGIWPGVCRTGCGGLMDWHYNRNQNQHCPDQSPDLYTGPPECPMQQQSTGWTYTGRSPTHGGNHDYRNPSTGFQCVYNDSGGLVTGQYEGTYDRSPHLNPDGSVSILGTIGHIVLDLGPYILWGD